MINSDRFTLNLNSKKILIVIVSLQLAFLGLIALDSLSLGIPILRQVIGFLYLTFVPGILLLGVFRINNLNTLETLLYSAGLSLSFLMFIGFLMNFFYPLIGISKPISVIPLTITISVITLVLCAIFYYRNKEFKISVSVKEITSPAVLLLVLLPFISIFGAYFFSYHTINIILLVLFGIIAIIPIIVSLDKFPTKVFPFLIWTISISLLLSVALPTKHLSYGDASVEYSYAKLVLANGFWDSSVFGNHNALLRIVMLHPIHSIMLNLNLEDVFRVIHPLLYSFTPLVLYIAFKYLTNEKTAFFSSYFFMSVFSFFVILSRNTRTGIAELFIALFILSLVSKNITNVKKSLLLLIFSLSIAVCHYGTSYLFMFALLTSTLLLALSNRFLSKAEKGNLTPTLSVLYVVFALTWYMYVSGSSSFETLVSFLSHMFAQMSELLSPETSYSVYALSRDWPFSVEVSKDLLLVAFIFIAIEVIAMIWNVLRKRELEFQKEFAALSIVLFGIVLATFLPAKGFNPARVIHLSLCFLASFSVIGFLRVCRYFGRIIKGIEVQSDRTYVTFSIFLAILFLFNSGFISETVTKGDDYSPNVMISKPRAMDINTPQYMYAYYREIISDQEFISARWLMERKDNSIKIYLDPYADVLFKQISHPLSKPWVVIRNRTIIEKGYIFLRTYNLVKKVSIIQTYPPEMKNISEVYPIDVSSKIYTNEGSEIYYC